jgi:hypothetical protein
MKTPQEWAQYAQDRGIVGAAEREHLASLLTTVQREAIEKAAATLDAMSKAELERDYERGHAQPFADAATAVRALAKP